MQQPLQELLLNWRLEMTVWTDISLVDAKRHLENVSDSHLESNLHYDAVPT